MARGHTLRPRYVGVNRPIQYAGRAGRALDNHGRRTSAVEVDPLGCTQVRQPLPHLLGSGAEAVALLPPIDHQEVEGPAIGAKTGGRARVAHATLAHIGAGLQNEAEAGHGIPDAPEPKGRLSDPRPVRSGQQQRGPITRRRDEPAVRHHKADDVLRLALVG